MANLIKKIKIKKEDGTYTDYIPIGAEARNVSTKDGESVETKLNKKPYYYNTVAEMITAKYLKENDCIITLGYYEINDGGQGKYTIVNDETLVEDSGSIHILDNKLKAKLIYNNEINIKQFGAKGNGTNDDTQAFKNAISYIENSSCKTLYVPNGQYLLNSSLIISDIIIKGESKENTILIANSFETEGFFKNKHYLNYGQFDTFTIENLTIYKKSLNLSREIGKRCFQLSCCNNCILKNLYLYSNIDTGFGGIDMYSNNKNILIENVSIEATNVTNNNLSEGISIREWGSLYTTENIIIRDCKIEKRGHDELLWISSWRGYIKNVLIDNCSFIDNDDTINQVSSIYIAGDLIDSVKNVKIVDSYFKRSALCYAFFKIGEAPRTNTTSDILLDNCTFECDQPQTNATSILRSGNGLFDNGLTISNCLFKNNQTDSNTKLGHFINGNPEGICNSINNSFIGMSNWSILNITSSKNDYIESNSSYPFRNCKIIDNPTIVNSHSYFLSLDHATFDKIYLKNISNATFTHFIATSTPANNTKIDIINCDINLADGVICDAYGVDENNILTLNLVSSNFNSSKKLTNSSYVIVNNGNTTYNYNSYGTIPTHEKSRNAFAVGTSFISSNPTKSIVRKISSGSSISNWEEI